MRTNKLSAFTPLKKAKSILKTSSFRTKKSFETSSPKNNDDGPQSEKQTYYATERPVLFTPCPEVDGGDATLDNTLDSELSPLTFDNGLAEADTSQQGFRWERLGAMVSPLFGGFSSSAPAPADKAVRPTKRGQHISDVISFADLRVGTYENSGTNAIIEPPAARIRRPSPVDLDEIQSRMEEGQSVDSSSSSFFHDEASWGAPSVTSFLMPTSREGVAAPPHMRAKILFDRDVSAITIMPSEDMSDSDSESECSDYSSAAPSHVMRMFGEGTGLVAQHQKSLLAINEDEDGGDNDDDDDEDDADYPLSSDDAEYPLSSDDEGGNKNLGKKIEKIVHDTDLDQVWIAKQVLDRYGKSRGKNLDNLVDEFCDKMDEWERKVFLKKQ